MLRMIHLHRWPEDCKRVKNYKVSSQYPPPISFTSDLWSCEQQQQTVWFVLTVHHLDNNKMDWYWWLGVLIKSANEFEDVDDDEEPQESENEFEGILSLHSQYFFFFFYGCCVF